MLMQNYRYLSIWQLHIPKMPEMPSIEEVEQRVFADPENVKQIRESLGKVLTPDMMERFRIFHLRGGINYGKLSLVHRSMMGMPSGLKRHLPTDDMWLIFMSTSPTLGNCLTPGRSHGRAENLFV